MTSIFSEIIEPDLERIPLLEIRHVERQNGTEFLISHLISKNVLTDFDRQLSRLLAAVRGGGFPRFTVLVRCRAKQEGGEWTPLTPMQHASVPHALKSIADRALSSGDGSGIVQRRIGGGAPEDSGITIPLGRREASSLADALTLCETIGESDFLDISGDFEAVVCRPSPEQPPLTISMRKGTVSIPTGRGQDSGSSDYPIADFTSLLAESGRLQSYIAASRHALAVAKEQAVSDFRAAAEAQVMAFDRALSGRPLEGFLMDAALLLIARLKAGLGEDLRGMSQHARITALQWSASAYPFERSYDLLGGGVRT